MAKKSSRNISKKNMPKGAKRITNEDGVRVWVYRGDEYKSLAEMNAALKFSQ
jgi:hypothetical protein